MIQAATGQTTTGVPINLNETTYDDVYGRMGLFKIGAGYRMSPRTRSGVQLRHLAELGGDGERRHRGRGQRAAVRELR